MSTNKSLRKPLPILRRRRLAVALAGALVMPPVCAQSLPTGNNLVSGTASVATSGQQMTITQSSQGAIIEWGSFSIGSAYGVTVDQQFGNSSVLLNRVVGGSASQIDGTLSANGSVFIINPAGITFGGSSQVSVGALVASTMGLSNANFNAGVSSGSYQFDPMDAVGNQAVTVDAGGSITTSAAGTVALIGRQVSNNGTISAPGGSVLFGSAENVTLDFQGDGLTMLTIQGPGVAKPWVGPCPALPCPLPILPGLSNSGTISADGGQILMRTAAAGLGGGDIFNSGTLRAQSLVSRNGRIELTTDGVVSLGYSLPSSPGYTGTLDVSGQAGASGGDVLVRAADFYMFNDDMAPDNPTGPTSAGSVINASGALNGGTVDILASNQAALYSLSTISANGSGGQGGQVTLSAATLAFGARAAISANGGAGAGGGIDVSASDSMSMYGLLSATGTSAGGNINTSTDADSFDLRGLRVEAGSPAAAGQWTLSVPALTVIAGSDAGELDSMLGGTNLQDAELNHALGAATNVTLQAAGDVSFNGAQVLAASSIPLLFAVNAGGSISGGNFAIASSSGALDMHFNADATGANTGFAGISFNNASLDSGGGEILMYGQSDATNGYASNATAGIQLSGVDIATGGGNLLLRGAATDSGAGIDVTGGSMDAGSGAITLRGNGASAASGVHIDLGTLQAGSFDIQGTASGSGDGIWMSTYQFTSNAGDIHLDGRGGGMGVYLVNYSGLQANGGALDVHGEGGTGNGTDVTGSIDSGGGQVSMFGSSTQANGLEFQVYSGTGIDSGGSNISLVGSGVTGGVILIGSGYSTSTIDSGGGQLDITGSASGALANGISMAQMPLSSGTGDINLQGTAPAGTSIAFGSGSSLAATSGDISLVGIGSGTGLRLDSGVSVTTDSGQLRLRGHGAAADADGLVIDEGATLSAGGGMDLAGEGGSGAGVVIGAGASLDAGDSLFVLRAGNDGSADAVRIDGAISSGLGVNLRPGGVDATGVAYDRGGDAIVLGDGNGFALNSAELALITAPQLVIGSSQHAGDIQVLEDISRNGNLTLQNQGGGDISLQAGLDVGDGTLALLSGGNISQDSAGIVRAHSLLLQAAGDALLGAAMNDVASTTLAGSAGGDFEYQDANALAVGSVAAQGFDASAGAMASQGSTGIGAGGDVLVRNLGGDLLLGAGVNGTNIDLVTAGRLQNTGGASLTASGDWRVWADTWVGETRGGLAGSGNLPNLYNCAYLGACGVTVASGDNHFIYVQQPLAVITLDGATREYGLANPVFSYTVSGAVLGDSNANIISGSGSSTAGIGSDVGAYAITGSFTSAAGYAMQVQPGVLTITPASLLFTADPATRFFGMPNPSLSGTVTGFRNGDTLESVFGTAPAWGSPAEIASPIGFYPILASAGAATNYVVVQAPGNATALRVLPMSDLPGKPVTLGHDATNTYVYDRNLASPPPACAINASLDDQPLASAGDVLAMEWSKVRTRPNLTNCFESERRGGCGDF